MEREIKFQIIYDNKICGYERLINDGVKTGWEWMWLTLNHDNGERWTQGVLKDSHKLIRRQYTGRKDKNEVEIYEGDIVKRIIVDYDALEKLEDEIGWDEAVKNSPKKEEVSKIVYRSSGFWVDDERFGWEGEGLWDWTNMEVIGNIYQHPELLTNNC